MTAANLHIMSGNESGVENREPVWPSGKAVGW